MIAATTRRTLQKNALVGLAALPASGLIREAAAQGALPHVDEKETLAVSLAYVQDVTKVDPSKTLSSSRAATAETRAVINSSKWSQATSILISTPGQKSVVRLQFTSSS